MTDKELLELAAKSAGIEGTWVGSFQCLEMYEPDGCIAHWNPLTDDGDALRLAVKLKLLDEHDVMYGQWNGEDPYEAQRRAIVRAAAEIGKNV